MKTLFIEAKSKNLPEISGLLALPDKIGLIYTVQYRQLFEKLKTELEKMGKKVYQAHRAQNIKQAGNSFLDEGQIIGCNIKSALVIEDKVDCFLLVSSGKFHALSLAMNTSLPIYIVGAGKIEQIPENEIERLKKKRKAAISKFLASDKIGIIASTKHGQNNLKAALDIKKKIKNSFVFVSDTINIRELENFKIDSWLNTACPGIAFDSSNIINLSDYQKIHKK